ncbi:DNA helicase loader [Synechococcus phage S-CAM7]|uniref:DNA helicase loader n=2 Tax=Synechococcus phage S-CAM7 TaxID=1883368 RepID=A0A1D8KU69_9CAUD|nr:DNA helicase loader [Synechococcus phage S-CAM7]AOV62189.1 loader of DNA helicase [Synechococcus phage S-CAM7]AOV62451.1 DNA helicase loader [Synechococcus phage S-CAM7]
MNSRLRRGIMSPYDVYTTYLAMKKHFTDAKFDFFRYNGKTRASVTAFNKRKDKYFFERMSRKLSDDEVKMYFIANFVATENPSAVWVGEIMQSGERHYKNLSKKYQSITYTFSQECSTLFDEYTLPQLFDSSKGHPPIIKRYLGGDISIETLTILDMIFGFCAKIDTKLSDPVWETVSFKVKKYRPFINIDITKCKSILRDIIHA